MCIYIYILVLHMSPSGDKSTADQEFCGNWQLLWTYLRSTSQLAAVLAVLKEPSRQSWSPGMAVLRPRQAVLRPREAVQEPRQAQQARRAGQLGSPRGPGGEKDFGPA